MLLKKRKIVQSLPLLIFVVALCCGRSAQGQIIIDTTVTLSPGEVLISELLFDPAVGGADYVELYNNSGEAFDLGQLSLVRWMDGAMHRFHPLPQGQLLAPQGYACLTTDKAWVLANYAVAHPSDLYELASMPPFPQGSGTVLLALSDSTVIDRFDYSDQLHSPSLYDTKGVALERRSFWLSANDPSNWGSASSSAGYGTPTGPNTAAISFVGSDLFALSTSLISPDGDGYNDQLEISFSLPQDNLLARLEIYDAAGRCVRPLFHGTLARQGTLIWDGTDSAGHLLPAGSYLLLVRTALPNTRRYWETAKFTVNIWK